MLSCNHANQLVGAKVQTRTGSIPIFGPSQSILLVIIRQVNTDPTK